ncbi:MAG: hypothetical protein AVDCRST_MAG27-136, partial [uncultured Craurococcus sp.]
GEGDAAAAAGRLYRLDRGGDGDAGRCRGRLARGDADDGGARPGRAGYRADHARGAAGGALRNDRALAAAPRLRGADRGFLGGEPGRPGGGAARAGRDAARRPGCGGLRPVADHGQHRARWLDRGEIRRRTPGLAQHALSRPVAAAAAGGGRGAGEPAAGAGGARCLGQPGGGRDAGRHGRRGAGAGRGAAAAARPGAGGDDHHAAAEAGAGQRALRRGSGRAGRGAADARDHGDVAV